jgi:hypothetical protein
MIWKKDNHDMAPKDAAIKYNNWATEKIINRELERFEVSK